MTVMIHILWDEHQAQALWGQGRDVYTPYLTEWLEQAGFACRTWTTDAWREARPKGVTIVAGLDEANDWQELLASYCDDGNAVLAVGDVFGLDALLGVRASRRTREGWISWQDEELAAGLRGSFHFYGAALVQTQDEVERYGQLLLRSGTGNGWPAVTWRRAGRGAAALLAVDLARTICLLQQGASVWRDGAPAPDGSAALDDDVLKADDSHVLDWERDRDSVDGGAPFFLQPIVDEFRILFVRLLHRLADATARPLAQVWFWPEGLDAVGHISHDTDGNDSGAAEKLLDHLAAADIRSSWCIIMPGYPESLYKRIADEGHEFAFHYNALEQDGASWDEALFRTQLDMLRGQLASGGIDAEVTMNKNHYLRWEGDTQFYHWCERAGIVVEQSKGGTKQGNKGFISGTCHPYRPMAAASERNRLFDVYSNPTLAWDPPLPARCTLSEAKALLDRCHDVAGVAHFLIHPANIKQHQSVGETMVELVRYGRERGLAWWTAVELHNWLTLRSGVRASIEGDFLRLESNEACRGVTVLTPDAGEASEMSPETAAVVRCSRTVERMGIRRREWILDVPAGTTLIPLRGAATAVQSGAEEGLQAAAGLTKDA